MCPVLLIYNWNKVAFTVKADREGGRPLELMVERLDINGFNANQEWSLSKFIAPCVFYAYTNPLADQTNGSASSSGTEKVLL
jgi:hypothetical protein